MNNDIKGHLIEYTESITRRSPKGNKKAYICPFCGSGTGGNGTGAFTITPDGTKWKCFSCERGGDVLDLIGEYENIETYQERLKRAGELFNIDVHTQTNTANDIHTTTYTQREDYREFYREAYTHIRDTDYTERRGLSKEIIDRFLIGYVEKWKHPNAPQDAPTTPRIIIPVTPTSYFARDTRIDVPDDQKAYEKMKIGEAGLFNAKALNESEEQPIFIVEGEIDALSVMEVGGVAVALGSTSNTNKLISAVKNKTFKRPLILALDNDTSGKNTQEKLGVSLTEINIPHIHAQLATTEAKDPNGMLIKDRAEFEKLVNTAKKEAKTEKERYLATATGNYLQEFIDGIANSVDTPYIPTGFSKLDEALDGGLYEGLYIIGAISSLGKTTIITQIADQVASQGQDVLIISLEMARSELIAKSISRHTAIRVIETGGDMRDAKTSRGITTGSRYENYSKKEIKLIEDATRDYGEYANNVYILEGVGDVGAKQIRDMVAKHVLYTGKAPLVIVDYLQILAPYNERYSDKQNTDKAVMELKRISRDFKTPVIGISSFNRDNYESKVSMQAFKESGSIEYSSDVLLGLQLKGAGERNFDPTEAKKANPREVELVILKNRNGATGSKIAYNFYSLFGLFKELDSELPETVSRIARTERTKEVKRNYLDEVDIDEKGLVTQKKKK